MLFNRPTVLSIAGFDPSGGAGILADIKVFEKAQVYGLGICTAITYQNDVEFKGMQWLGFDVIAQQIQSIFSRFEINFAKIGLIENFDVLEKLLLKLFLFNPEIKVIWDPVICSSTGFEFHKGVEKRKLDQILKKIFMLTPNIGEIKFLSASNDVIKTSCELSFACKVYLKGGHGEGSIVEDILFEDGHIAEKFQSNRIVNGKKHGSGCVLSAALVANLAKGQQIKEACYNARTYTQNFLKSNNTLLGYHAETC